MRCVSFDPPPVAPIATRKIAEAGLSERVTAVGGDFCRPAAGRTSSPWA
jgi:hypothetical protein